MSEKKTGIKRGILGICKKYVDFVERATCGSSVPGKEDILYWREKLFTKFITFLLPTCLIALVPGVFMAFKGGFLAIAYADLLAVCSIAVVSLNAKLSLPFRKGFVIVILYVLSIALIIDLSLLGPGIVYLLALSVLITVIFPRLLGYWSVAANFFICLGCALIIHFKLLDSAFTRDYELGTWIAVSSNLIFLSFVIVIIVSNTIKGFENLISREHTTNNELQAEIIKVANINSLLIESESQFKGLFLLNPSPMWVLDSETLQFLHVNEAAIQQYGYTNEEFLSMNVQDIKMARDKQTMYADLSENKKTGVPLSIITEHRRKNQEHFFAEVTFNSILFNARSATLAISQDISEYVNYINAIESQNEKFKEIAWIQSHNVRGPLATILGLTQLFIDKEIVVETEEIIAGIIESSGKLDIVIREIVSKTSIAEFQIIPASHYGKALLPLLKNEI